MSDILRRLRRLAGGATHRSVPRHSGRRPAHARPRPSSDVPAALLRAHPLTPLSERDRRPRPWRGHGRLAAIASAAVIAVVAIPLLGAALTQGAPALQPLAGGVAGAVSVPSPSSSASAGETPTTVDPRLLPTGATDADSPPTVFQRGPTPAAWLTGYRWPISKGRVTLPFKAIPGGEWINDGRLFHDGVDMASFCGAPVAAAHDGIVLAAGRRFDDQIGWLGDLGPYKRRLDAHHTWGDLPIVVVIDDGNGYRSIYAHFRDVTVRAGQRVKAGKLIGHEGATGHASGCHVHYGLFSPRETRTFGVRADILRRMKLPNRIIARVDPLLVLPGGDVALRTRSIEKAIASARLVTDGSRRPVQPGSSEPIAEPAGLRPA
jgi:murein DD-endopeptidase MepM/ murein hydrolase activator NlpD